MNLVTENIEIVDVRVVRFGSIAIKCDPRTPKKYWYTCEAAVGKLVIFTTDSK